ncbi:MAG TPA: sugar phosphate nucleotidyltransferase [Polyangia bacterium]|nr:sugar phosphate nucleotidyltransferase [Polyangia bacterium]
MSTSAVYAIILAGGGGTRLWPASRRLRPKQLLSLGGDESLLAATARRAGAVVGAENTLVVTAADQELAIRAALPGLPAANVLVEPQPRNTAAAVGLAAAAVVRRAGPEAVLAVLPADPHIADEAAFTALVRAAIAEARQAIVTIGVTPSSPETGFGYLRVGPRVGGDGSLAVFDVAAFVEKPDRPAAEAYLASGQYLWNSGMFFLTAGRMLAEARRHLPALGEALEAMVGEADFTAAVRARYAAVPAISIDHGIMEKAAGIRVIPGTFGWNDVGSWAALPAMRPADARGNVVVGQAALIDGDGSVVYAEPGAPYVGVVGARDLVVVATRDAVLVIPKNRAQDVRQIVDAARRAGRDDLL